MGEKRKKKGLGQENAIKNQIMKGLAVNSLKKVIKKREKKKMVRIVNEGKGKGTRETTPHRNRKDPDNQRLQSSLSHQHSRNSFVDTKWTRATMAQWQCWMHTREG